MSTKGIDSSGKLFDHIICMEEMKNDARLGEFLELAPPVISKIRTGRNDVSEATILRVHEKTAIPVAEIRSMLPKPTRAKRGPKTKAE